MCIINQITEREHDEIFEYMYDMCGCDQLHYFRLIGRNEAL